MNVKQGQQLYPKSLKRDSIHRIMSCLSEEEVRQMNACLEKLKRRGMKELGMKRDMFFSP
jgi:hypothetical protein